MDRRTLLRALGTTAVAATASGCVLQGGDGQEEAGTDPGSLPPDIQGTVLEENLDENLRIPDSQLYRGQRAFGVLGTVRNVGDRPMEHVEVHVRLLDPDDGLLGEFYDDHADEQEVWRLEPGEAENFDVRFPDTEPSTVEEAVRYEVWATGREAGPTV